MLHKQLFTIALSEPFSINLGYSNAMEVTYSLVRVNGLFIHVSCMYMTIILCELHNTCKFIIYIFTYNVANIIGT